MCFIRCVCACVALVNDARNSPKICVRHQLNRKLEHCMFHGSSVIRSYNDIGLCFHQLSISLSPVHCQYNTSSMLSASLAATWSVQQCAHARNIDAGGRFFFVKISSECYCATACNYSSKRQLLSKIYDDNGFIAGNIWMTRFWYAKRPITLL